MQAAAAEKTATDTEQEAAAAAEKAATDTKQCDETSDV